MKTSSRKRTGYIVAAGTCVCGCVGLLFAALAMAQVGAEGGRTTVRHNLPERLTRPVPPPWEKAPEPVPKDATGMRRALHELARVATAMVDGELCKNIVTQRAKEKIFHVNPRDKWAAGDNYDVNHEPFIKVKQTLQRIALLVDWPVDCNLWMPCEVNPKKWYLVVRQKNVLCQFWKWNAVYQDPIPEMVQVLKTGKRIEVSKRPGWLSVLTPVYDSLGNIVAVVEVCSRQDRYGQRRN